MGVLEIAIVAALAGLALIGLVSACAWRRGFEAGLHSSEGWDHGWYEGWRAAHDSAAESLEADLRHEAALSAEVSDLSDLPPSIHGGACAGRKPRLSRIADRFAAARQSGCHG